MENVAEQLTKAKALIDTPDKWFKGCYSDRGDCLCALGAVIKSKFPDTTRPMQFETKEFYVTREITYLRKSLPDGREWIADFNDDADTTHEDIMKLFDTAIEKAKQDGK